MITPRLHPLRSVILLKLQEIVLLVVISIKNRVFHSKFLYKLKKTNHNNKRHMNCELFRPPYRNTNSQFWFTLCC